MIEAKHVTLKYPGAAQPALDEVSVGFPRNAISAIVGESGSGKTTLMMCLGRFLHPTRGKTLYDGRDVFDIPEHTFRQRVGMVFQKLYLFPHLTIIQNMVLAMCHAFDRDRDEARGEAQSMLTRLGIDDIGNRYPSQISGGQAQRAAIARGLLLKPDFMLLDEPTSALDARTTDSFAEWLKMLKDQTNFIIVTHDILFARRAADQGVCLMSGRIAGEGPIEEAIQHLRATPDRGGS